jgi:hypothetical protein
MGRLRGILTGAMVLWVLAFAASAIGALVTRSRRAWRWAPSDDEVDLATIFEGRELRIMAGAFRGGRLLAWYGGGTIDLRGATLDPGGARLSLRALFGGYRIVVPASWPVDLAVTGVFGGIGDGRDPTAVDPSLPALFVDGWAAFGGAGIVSEAPDLDEHDALDPAAATEPGAASAPAASGPALGAG